MKYRSMVTALVFGAVALLTVGGYAAQQKSQAINVYAALPASEEAHRTYQLAEGAHVDVSYISGPVSVEPTDGQSAEVHIYRTAKNSNDLTYRKVIVEQTSSGLTIRQKMGEYGIPGRRYFRKHNQEGIRTHNIHTFEAGSAEVERHLAFRDYMIAHPGDARRYSELKMRLADEHPQSMDGYMDGKDGFIKEIDRMAAQWRTSQAG